MYIKKTVDLSQTPYGRRPRPERINGLGYAPPAGLVLLKHFHRPFDGTANLFLPVRLKPENVDPHYDLANTSLQTGLRSILQEYPFKNLLVDKTAAQPSYRDKVRVALVDLTGPKLFRPLFAGYGSTVPMRAASLSKILALLAAFQFRFDLSQLAFDSKPQISTKTALIKAAIATGYPGKNGALAEMLELKENAGNPLGISFTTETWNHLRKTVGSDRHTCGCCSNGSSTWLIHHLGFRYIASVAWQYGLRHPVTKGLWLRRDYGTLDECQQNLGRRTPLPNKTVRPEARWSPEWGTNPLNTFPHECNAQSVARFFTLLAQGRLVDVGSSQQLREHIMTQGYEGAFGPAFPGLRISSKVGRLKPPEGFVDHQGAIIRRTKNGKVIHYVAVILTQEVERDSGIVKSLVLKLDQLVSLLN